MTDLIIGVAALVVWVGLWLWGAVETSRRIDRIVTGGTDVTGGGQ